jgi:amino acid transporter
MGAQLAAARLLYGMGRSNAIPRRLFGAIDPKRHIPMNNVIIIGAIALVGGFFISYENGVELLNYGAFIAFMGVNAAAFVRYYLMAREKHLSSLLFTSLGFCICLFIWLNLGHAAKIVGSIWLMLGVLYGAIRTKGFRSGIIRFDAPTADL